MTAGSALYGLVLPVAAREQGQLSPHDWQLTAAARERHPAARWWWGERVIDGRNGAFCYLCDTLVATWARSWPTPATAIDDVMTHRHRHLAGYLPIPGTMTAGKSPAVGAPPPEGQE